MSKAGVINITATLIDITFNKEGEPVNLYFECKEIKGLTNRNGSSFRISPKIERLCIQYEECSFDDNDLHDYNLIKVYPVTHLFKGDRYVIQICWSETSRKIAVKSFNPPPTSVEGLVASCSLKSPHSL